MMRRSALGVAFALLAAGAIGDAAAQGAAPAWSAIQAAARKEAKVVLYNNAVQAVSERLKADFEKANPGIVLEWSRLTGAPLVVRVEEERKSGAEGADIVITTEIVWLDDRAREGAFKEPVGPARSAWPADYTLRGAVPILALEPLGIVYNTKLVSGAITGYADIVRPEYKGKLGTSDLVSSLLVAWYDWLEKTQGGDFLQRFGSQAPRSYVGAVPGTQAAVSGEVAINAFSNPSVSLPLIEQGAPIRLVIPKPSFGIRYGGAVLGWAKRPNAALVFMDYLMSMRGQTTWSGRGETASPLPNVPGALDAKSINAYDPRPYTPEVVKAYTEKWNKVFKPR